MKFELHLVQDAGPYVNFKNERPDEIMEIHSRTKKEAMHICLDKLFEAPKKYEGAFLFDNKNNMVFHIKR